MTRTDFLLRCDIQNILANGVKDENPRPRYPDGTPAYTYFVTHNVRSYRLDKGEFPICTLRPIAWKSAIKEMFWIYQEQSNDLYLLNTKYRVKAWNEWEGLKPAKYTVTFEDYNGMQVSSKDYDYNTSGSKIEVSDASVVIEESETGKHTVYKWPTLSTVTDDVTYKEVFDKAYGYVEQYY